MQKKKSSTARIAVLRAFVVTWALGPMSWSQTHAAPPAEPTKFNIPAGDLATALKSFGEQSDTDVLFDPQLAAFKRTAGLTGEYATEDGLRILLAPANLQFRVIDGKTVLIESADGLGLSPAAGAAEDGSPRKEMAEGAADSAGVQAGELEEIVVTARKREERLQDVPAAVTAVNTDALARNGLLRITDYQALVPGLNVNDGTAGGGQMSPSLRGVTTGAGGRPTVATFIDDVPVGRATSGGFMPDIDPAELERIEVLRGPQGTLYGGGTIGGLIRFITRSPDFDELSGRLEVGSTSVDHGGLGWSARGSINAPINDRFAVRASAYTREDPGFIRNVQTAQDDSNVRSYDGGRLSLGIRLGGDWMARLTASTHRIHADANPVIDVVNATGVHVCGGVPCGDLETSRAPGSDNSNDRDTIYDLRITGSLGWADFLSSTAYDERDYRSNFDYSPVFGGIASAIFGVPNLGVAVLSVEDSERLSQEIRLNSPGAQRIDWQVGAFYTNERSFGGQDVRVFDLPTGNPPSPPLPNVQSTRGPTRFEELAGFGNVTFKITSRFDFTLGARYSRNTSSNTTVTTVPGPAGLLSATSVAPEDTDDSFTYLVNPSFKVTDDMMIYARLATGFRPGGPNKPNPNPAVPATFSHDTVVNYELGLKAETPGRALRFNGAVYYVKWEDIQVSQRASGLTYFINGSQAHSQGAEVELDWRPFSGFALSGNVSFNEAELDEPFGNALTAVPAGARLPDTPRWSSYLSGEYQMPLNAQWNGSLGASWHYVGERMGTLAASAFVLPSYRTYDVQLGASSDKYSIALFARNLTDERGYLSSFPFPPLEQVAVIQPRTFGVSVSTSF